MSDTPHLVPGLRWGFRMGHRELPDVMHQDGLRCPVTGLLMGETIERLAGELDSPRHFLSELAGVYRKAAVAGHASKGSEGNFDRPWRIYRRLNGALGEARDRELLRQLESGLIEITLHGRKLKGNYALVKTRGRGKNDWLLVKMNDEFASPEDITLKDKSVLSGKTLAGVKNSTTRIHVSKRVEDPAMKSKKEAKASSTIGPAEIKADIKLLLKRAPASKLPSGLAPMLATLVDEPFDRQGWIYEVKWDGYRALAFLNKGSVELKSRNDKSFSKRFYPVTRALKEWDVDAVLDGEIVAVGENGVPDFESLQDWRTEADGYLFYYVFDILWLEGRDLTGLPLTERRRILKSLMPEDGVVKMSDSFDRGDCWRQNRDRLQCRD